VTPQALILTYHGVESAEGPLFVDPGLFASHLDCIVESGARVLTVSEVAHALRHGALEGRNVAISFDDGMESVTRVAAPLLAERGLRATVFCVAGHVGGKSNWPSARPGAPSVALSSAEALAGLIAAGWEIGCHGMSHAPLETDDEDCLRREVVDAKHVLEDMTGATVTSFAYPYGAGPTPEAWRLVSSSYEAACSTAVGVARRSSEPYALPRVDSHYVRRIALLRAALSGELSGYLRLRRLGASARRTLRADFRKVTTA
jgi:peptidoglycan/xylan/chitin deacetylase (PgdA/CDA1 family)